jgi:homoserine dehydrogenase
MVDASSPFGGVTDSFNRISVTSNYEGETAFFGYGAGRYPTAYAVVGDLVDILEANADPYSECFEPLAADNTCSVGVYYIRTTASIPSEIISEKLEDGVLTHPVSVAKMHEIKDDALKTDSGFFFARVN